LALGRDEHSVIVYVVASSSHTLIELKSRQVGCIELREPCHTITGANEVSVGMTDPLQEEQIVNGTAIKRLA